MPCGRAMQGYLLLLTNATQKSRTYRYPRFYVRSQIGNAERGNRVQRPRMVWVRIRRACTGLMDGVDGGDDIIVLPEESREVYS